MHELRGGERVFISRYHKHKETKNGPAFLSPARFFGD
jgi:hypothetical protein